MTSWERSQIVAIAEEVCIGNRAMSSTTNFDQTSTSADNMAATPEMTKTKLMKRAESCG